MTINELPKVIQEWDYPQHGEFLVRNRWSMLNSFTEAMKGRQEKNPSLAAHETIAFRRFLLEANV